MFQRGVKKVPQRKFVGKLLIDYMQLEQGENIEIMRAHRTPTTRRGEASKPCPIHVYLLRFTDRQYIL